MNGVVIALLLGAVAGALLPLQTAINSGLSSRLGAVLPASLISFAVGSAGLGLLVLVTGTAVPWAETAATQPWWIWVGGACGLVFRTMNIVLMPWIGASATVVLPIVGQVLGGLVIDMTGAFDATVLPLDPSRVIGVVLVVLGAALVSQSGRRAVLEKALPVKGPHVLLWVVVVLVGSLGSIQTAANGRLGQAMDSALAAALVSFLISTVGLGVITLIVRPRLQRSGPIPLWALGGGLAGAGFVLANAVNAPVLGVSLTVSIMVFGQVAAGLVLDHWGLLGVQTRPITLRRLAGAELVLLGVALERFAG